MAVNPFKKVLRKVADNFAKTQQRFQAAMRSKGATAATNAVNRLKTPPGPVRYTGIGKDGQAVLNWTTDKQRRAFFATDGFGRGIPTRRKNNIVDAWQTEFIPSSGGGILVLQNDNPAAPFVQGFNQQGFHRDTGWVTTADVADQFFQEGGGSVVEVWHETADPLQGV